MKIYSVTGENVLQWHSNCGAVETSLNFITNGVKRIKFVRLKIMGSMVATQKCYVQ
jgi:hypothetical protein